MKFAFEQLQLDEIVSFTSWNNHRSQAVMKRLHMQDSKENFFHPAIADANLLQEHVLFRLNRQHWYKLQR